MKNTIRVLSILLVVLLLSVDIQAQPGSQPHPDPHSEDLSNYEGKWIIDGKTEQDTNWTLEISGNEYHMYNEYNDYTGEIIFTPGYKEFDRPDTLWLEFDPDLGIEVVLENRAGGLVDISGQGLFFVKPGNRINFDEVEEYQDYSKDDMIGDWVLDKFYIFMMEFDYAMYLTNEDIMAGSITGDTRLILSFDNGILYEVSETLEIRVPITHYRNIGRNRLYFENPKPIQPIVYKFTAYFVPEKSNFDYAGQMVLEAYPRPPGSEQIFFYLVFSRITSADLSKGGE
ncbi:MAG: hypothetical protein GX328_01870 [Clostridiaceae bacterium]|nr:hypothetical protein [Clostridiaceae bacterium]